MDFPMVLTNASDLEFVYGYDELKQCIYLLLKTDFGRFLQQYALGTRASVHVSDPDVLEVAVRRTLSQINGLSIDSVRMVGDNIRLSVVYRGNLSNFEFSVSSF